jgi:hypothetical protein
MIEIPKEQRAALSLLAVNTPVRVIILASEQQPVALKGKSKDLLQDAKDKGYDDFIEYLMDHPFDVPNPVRYTREELHER